jgi:hypothetical protein
MASLADLFLSVQAKGAEDSAVFALKVCLHNAVASSNRLQAEHVSSFFSKQYSSLRHSYTCKSLLPRAFSSIATFFYLHDYVCVTFEIFFFHLYYT